MTRRDALAPTVSDFNHQVYQHLKLTLTLNLRRQLLIAVCDDLQLRNHLAVMLHRELTGPLSPEMAAAVGLPPEAELYRRFVSLTLNPADPNPMAQIRQWLVQHAAVLRQEQGSPPPCFQILGVEQLTRQPIAIQRLFLSYLQGVGQTLSGLESSVLIWVPKPWLRLIQQTSPEFWRWRSGVFEFAGEPMPVNPMRRSPRKGRPRPLGSPGSPGNGDIEPDHHFPKGPQGSSGRRGLHGPGRLPKAAQLERISTERDRLLTLLNQDLATLRGTETAILREVEATSVRVVTEDPETAEAPSSDRLLPPSALPETPGATEAEAIAPARAAGAEESPATDCCIDEADWIAVAQDAAAAQSAAIATTADGVAAPAEAADETAAIALDLADSLPESQSLVRHIRELLQQQASPLTVVSAYLNLCYFYRDRIEQGDSSRPVLDLAIQAYQQTLKILETGVTPDFDPLLPDLLNDLGNFQWMYARLLSAPEERIACLQQGIMAYEIALLQVDFAQQPQVYARVQNNLGAVYGELARWQNAAVNLRKSIQAYQVALEYRQAADDPLKYAATQNNLGTAHWNLAQHEQPGQNLHRAIAAYREALQHYDASEQPLNHAMIQNNLGTAYWNLAQYEAPITWLAEAVTAYQVALRHRTLDQTPTAYAATQNNLGTAYWHLANHAKDQPDTQKRYYRQAIAAYEAALTAAQYLAALNQSTLLTFDPLATHNNLGLAHYQLATHPRQPLDKTTQAQHLTSALENHLHALQGWQQKPDQYQTALNYVIQTVRAFYTEQGLEGQNQALSKLPGHLLPELLPRL